MFALRRSALRVLATSPSSLANKPRSITSLSQSLLKARPSTQSSYLQRRWASDEAKEGVPVSELQPTPQEEVENAISEDNQAAEAQVGSGVAEAAASGTEAAAETSDPAVEAAVESIGESSSQSSAIPAADASPSANATSEGAAAVFESTQSRERQPRSDREPTTPKPTVYIGNLFFDVTEDDLAKELARFGKIVRTRLLRDSRGLSKGFGYVDFDTTEAATAAISALHQQYFEGRRIVVQYATFTSSEIEASRRNRMSNFSQPPKNEPTRTLFIGNMSFEMTDRDLNNLFRGIRNVVDVRVAIDRRTGQPRGFAHADFVDVKSAMDAMNVLKDKETYGRKLRLDYSHGASSNAAPKNQVPPPTRDSQS